MVDGNSDDFLKARVPVLVQYSHLRLVKGSAMLNKEHDRVTTRKGW